MGIAVWTTHSLEKLFPHTEPPARAPGAIRLKAARNESEDAQIVVRPPKGATVDEASVRFSDLVAESGARIPSERLTGHWQWYTYVLHNPPWSRDPSSWMGTAPGFYPDAFLEDSGVRIAAEWTQPLWVRVRAPEDAEAGTYRGEATVVCRCASGEIEEIPVPIELTVWPFTLPARCGFHHTEWFSAPVVAQYYRLEAWSEAHWDWIRKVAEDMADHRVDMIFTSFRELVEVVEHPCGEWSFDFTRLDRWIATFRAAGVEWVEGAHVAGRAKWTAPFEWRLPDILGPDGKALEEYAAANLDADAADDVMRRWLQAIYAHLEERWGLDKVVQHIADEPLPENLESWLPLRDKVMEWLPGVRNIDAVMCEELIGKVDMRVPQIQELDPAKPARPGEELWSYVCLAPQGHGPNRFLDIASIRNRILFWISFSLKLDGFLHWGYAQWRKWGPAWPESVDFSPWTDAAAGTHYNTDYQKLPSGDAYIVYPGKTRICSSLRWEVVRKGIEDLEMLRMLEEAAHADGGKTEAGRKALSLIARIRADLAHDARVYTRDDRDLLAAREEAGDLLAELTLAASRAASPADSAPSFAAEG